MTNKFEPKQPKMVFQVFLFLLQLAQGSICDLKHFPKFLGGFNGNTNITQIDVHEQSHSLLVGGHTYDKELSGIFFFKLPIVGMIELNQPTTAYRWLITDTKKVDHSFDGVCISADSSIVSALSNSLLSSYIMILDGSTGALITSRSYKQSNMAHRSEARQIIIGSGPENKAYVLSSLMPRGQHLFKFDPYIYSANPIWAKTSSNSDFGNAITYGIIFGNKESILYTYGIHLGVFKVSRIDADSELGIIQWTYGLNGYLTESQALSHLQANSTYELLAFTTQTAYPDRLHVALLEIPSLKEPFIPTTAQEYYAALPINIKVKGLRIISRIQINVLHTLNNQTFVGIIDLDSMQFQQNRLLPYLPSSYSTIGVFTDDQKFYFATFGTFIYNTNALGTQTLGSGAYQGIVFSSDSSKACYQTFNIQTLYTLFLSTIEAQQFEIFYLDNPGFEFYTDLNSQLEPLQQQRLTPDTFCSEQQYTGISSNQNTNVLFFQAGLANTQSITAFHATQNCGSDPATYTYSGIDDFDNTLLDSSDFISVSQTTGAVSVSSASVPGSYKIKIVGTLPNNREAFQYFEITVSSTSAQNPHYQYILRNTYIYLNQTYQYCFNCGIIDPLNQATGAQSVSLSPYEYYTWPYTVSISSSSGSFVQYYFKFRPTLLSQIRSYVVSVFIQAGTRVVENKFKIFVLNSPPYFTGSLPSIITPNFKTIYNLYLPTMYDYEGLAVNLRISSGPPFVTKISNTLLQVQPQDCKTDLLASLLILTVEDSQLQSKSYAIFIQAYNLPPKFQGTLQTQSLGLKKIKQYSLPSVADPERCMVVITFAASPGAVKMTTLTDSTFLFQPKEIYEVGLHNISVTLTDDGGAQSFYWFTLRIVDFPKFISPLARKLDVRINSVLQYSLPIDPDEHFTILHSLMPTYCIFNTQTYILSPKTPRDMQQTLIRGSLDNDYNILLFEIRVNVINDPPFLTTGPPNDVYVLVGSQISLVLSEYDDKEKLPITLQTNEAGQRSLPSFMSFDKASRTYIIAPTKAHKLGEYIIQIKLIDKFGAMRQYKFKVNTYEIGHGENVEQKKLGGNMENIDDNNSYKASIQIRAISRDGICLLKINSEKYSDEISKQINNQSFQINLITQSNSTQILYDIKSKNTKRGEISIKLKFPNPKSVSAGSELDTIKITVQQRVTYNGTATIATLFENHSAKKSVPPQLSSDMAGAASTFQGGRIAVAKNQYINFFVQVSRIYFLIRSMIIQFVWSQLDDLSFLTINTMISLTVPGIAQIIQQVLMSLIYLDILLTEKWMPQILLQINGYQNEQIENDQPLNSYFDENGFESIYFLRNIGSSIVYLAVYILLWFFYIILNISNRICQKFTRLVDWLRDFLMWNFTLQIIQSQFVPFVISSVINLYDINFKTPVIKISTILSLTLLPIFLGSLLFNFLIVNRNREFTSESQKKEFLMKYRYLDSGLRLPIQTKKSLLIPYWNFLYLLRWTVTIGILTGLKNFPTLQVYLLILISISFQGMTLIAQPYDNFLANAISFFNEFMNSLYLYALLTLTDVQENNKREKTSQWLFYIVIVTVLVNILKAAIINFLNIAKSVKEIWKKNKARIEEFRQSRVIEQVDVTNVKNQQDQSISNDNKYFVSIENWDNLFSNQKINQNEIEKNPSSLVKDTAINNSNDEFMDFDQQMNRFRDLFDQKSNQHNYTKQQKHKHLKPSLFQQ